MARQPKKVRTFHLLAVAESLEEQNQAVGMLLQACITVADLSPKAPGMATLLENVERCREAFFGEGV